MTRQRDLSGRRVLIAGGAGFIGSHLCDAVLAHGDAVICVDSFLTSSKDNIQALVNHPRFELIEADICAPFKVRGRVDQVYNLASPASPPRYQADPAHTMLTNVLGTAHLLELAARHGARFLQASTSEIYGDPEEHPQREDYWGHVNCTGPRACYDEGKRSAEALCFDFLRADRADVRITRIFNTYGPRMSPEDGRIVSNLIVQALTGQPLTIYGTGEQTRSFCFVSDLVEGLIALMNLKDNPGLPVNLGNPGEFTVNQLARFILDQTGSASLIVYDPLPQDDPQRRRPDITRANALLGWQPQVPLAEGLNETIGYFVRHLGALPRASEERFVEAAH